MMTKRRQQAATTGWLAGCAFANPSNDDSTTALTAIFRRPCSLIGKSLTNGGGVDKRT
jgi:hypothetical protein